MHLKNLVAVILRIALLFGLLNLILGIISFIAGAALSHMEQNNFSILAIVFQLGVIVLYVLAWIYAEPLCAFAVKGFDEPISLQALTQEQIYICGFIFIGLLSCVSSLEQFIKFVFVVFNTPSLKEFINPLAQTYPAMIEFAVGLWMIFGCRKTYRFLKKFIDPDEEPKQP